MDYYLLTNALTLVVTLSIPFLLAVVVAALFSGIIEAATQIQDPVFGFVAKLAAVLVVGSLVAGYYSGEVTEFSRAMWGNSQFYK